MVTINYAYTEKINPAGATPVLTRDQVWTGLQIKQKHPEAFVPVIERTEVISESENELIRMVYFKGKDGQPGEQVKEVCNSYYPTRVRLPPLPSLPPSPSLPIDLVIEEEEKSGLRYDVFRSTSTSPTGRGS